MEETLSHGGPVDSEHTEALWGQCQQYHTQVNYNNQDDGSREQLQVILHYPDQGQDAYAADPRHPDYLQFTIFHGPHAIV